MNQSVPSITFVIPVRNDATRLRTCLRSIEENDYPSDLIQIVVVDNGSTDGSATVGRESGATVLTRAGKVAELRNAGAAAARGEVLAFVDADHVLDRGWLRALASCMESDRVAAAGAPYIGPPDGTWVQRCYDGLRVHRAGRHQTDWLGSGNMAVRRDVFSALGGFDVSLATCEDVDLCQKIRAAGQLILDDSGLRSVHAGDPRTLKALFFGELWRGRDNLRATLRGPKTFRHVRSAIIPIIGLLMLTGVVAAPIFFQRWVAVAIACLVVLGGLSALRAVQMIRNARLTAPVQAVQAFVVALIYDVARALALVVRVGHQTRRSGETVSSSQTL